LVIFVSFFVDLNSKELLTALNILQNTRTVDIKTLS